jgi:hypothetical protein
MHLFKLGRRDSEVIEIFKRTARKNDAVLKFFKLE